jgi:hypothetical protein
MDANQISSRAVEGKHLEHKHGLDEWSPMMPERSGQSVIVGEEPEDEMYRCQRVGCGEVVRLKPDHGAR